MARRSGSIAVAEGPAWTTIFESAERGGLDGPAPAALVIGCADGSANPLEYRVDPGDPAGETAPIEIGGRRALGGGNPRVQRVQARGLGGDATATVEVAKN